MLAFAQCSAIMQVRIIANVMIEPQNLNLVFTTINFHAAFYVITRIVS